MPLNDIQFIHRIESAFEEIAYAPDISDREKMDRLRDAYRQAWFATCQNAQAKWIERSGSGKAA